MDYLVRMLEDWLLPLRLFFGHKYMYEKERVVVKIWPNRLVKGPVYECEIEALVYVASCPGIHAPKVHRVYHRKDGLYVERDFVEGVLLETIWNGLSKHTKKLYVEQAWAQLTELRTHAPRQSLGTVAVASISGGPIKDGALSLDLIGPYNSLEEFEGVLRTNPNRLAFPPEWDTSDEMRKTVLTNGDISPRNIVVNRVGQPSSIYIIDWEFGGWWPAYWERVKWHFSDFPPGAMQDWLEMMDEVSGMSSSK